MDRGIPTEEVLKEMRNEGVQYLVGTPKGNLTKLEKSFLALPWKVVHEGVRVKLLNDSNELWVLARSTDRASKEMAMRRRKLKKLFNGLLALRRQAPTRDTLLQRIGVLKHDAGRAAGMVETRCRPSKAWSRRKRFTGHCARKNSRAPSGATAATFCARIWRRKRRRFYGGAIFSSPKSRRRSNVSRATLRSGLFSINLKRELKRTFSWRSWDIV